MSEQLHVTTKVVYHSFHKLRTSPILDAFIVTHAMQTAIHQSHRHNTTAYLYDITVFR